MCATVRSKPPVEVLRIVDDASPNFHESRATAEYPQLGEGRCARSAIRCRCRGAQHFALVVFVRMHDATTWACRNAPAGGCNVGLRRIEVTPAITKNFWA